MAQAQSLPGAGDSSGAFGNIISQRAATDRRSATALAMSLPPNRTRNSASNSLAAQRAYADPDARLSQIENVAQHWLRYDREAAEAWLGRTGLPDERKQRLLADTGNWRGSTPRDAPKGKTCKRGQKGKWGAPAILCSVRITCGLRSV